MSETPWKQTLSALQNVVRFNQVGEIIDYCPNGTLQVPDTRNPTHPHTEEPCWGLKVTLDTVSRGVPLTFSFTLPLTTTRGTWIVGGKEWVPPHSDTIADKALAKEILKFQYSGPFIKWMRVRRNSRSPSPSNFIKNCVKRVLDNTRKKGLPPGKTGLHHLFILAKAGRFTMPQNVPPSAIQILSEALPLLNNSTELPAWLDTAESRLILATELPGQAANFARMPFVDARVEPDTSVPENMVFASTGLAKSLKTTLRKQLQVGDPLGLIDFSGPSDSPRLIGLFPDENRVIRIPQSPSASPLSMAVVSVRDRRNFRTRLANLHSDILSSDALAKELLARFEQPPPRDLLWLHWKTAHKKNPWRQSRLLSFQFNLDQLGCCWTVNKAGLGIESTRIRKQMGRLPAIKRIEIFNSFIESPLVPGMGNVVLLVNPSIQPGVAAISPDLFKNISRFVPKEENVMLFGAHPIRLKKSLGEGVANVAVHPRDAERIQATEVFCFASRHPLAPRSTSPTWLDGLCKKVKSHDVFSIQYFLSYINDVCDQPIRIPLDHPITRRVLGDLSHLQQEFANVASP